MSRGVEGGKREGIFKDVDNSLNFNDLKGYPVDKSVDKLFLKILLDKVDSWGYIKARSCRITVFKEVLYAYPDQGYGRDHQKVG